MKKRTFTVERKLEILREAEADGMLVMKASPSPLRSKLEI